MSIPNGEYGSPLPLRQPMDAKANTHFCVAPITPIDDDTGLTKAHSAYLIVVGGGIPGTMHPSGRTRDQLGPIRREFRCSSMISRFHVAMRLFRSIQRG